MPVSRPPYDSTVHGETLPNVPNTWFIAVNGQAEQWITETLGPTGSGAAVAPAPSADRLTVAIALADAGFPQSQLAQALAVAYSQGAGILYFHANHQAGTPGFPNAGYQRGPLGLEYPGGPSLGCAMRLDCAARFFYSITQSQGWNAHQAFRTGQYLSQLSTAQGIAAQYESGEWRAGVPGGGIGSGATGGAGIETGWSHMVRSIGERLPSETQRSREIAESMRHLPQ